MRATIGHLSRNIKIIGNVDQSNDWGSTVFLYHWQSND